MVEGTRRAARARSADGDGLVADSPAGGERPATVAAIVERARAADLVALSLVPVALVAVHLLPRAAVDGWRLSVLHPTLPAAYLSHFVHGSPAHLLANLAGYAVLASLTYALCLSAGRRREFLAVLATYLLAFPFALSWLNVALTRSSVTYGFSGVVMAFLGFVPLATAWHVRARFRAPTDGSLAPLGFFLGAGLVAAFGAPRSPLALTAVGLSAVAVATYLRSAAATAGGLANLVSARDVAAPGRVELAAAGLLVVVAFPLAAFPADPTDAGVVANLYAHALGYCLGFVVPYARYALLESDRPLPAVVRDLPNAMSSGSVDRR